jgi:hypothetical protein
VLQTFPGGVGGEAEVDQDLGEGFEHVRVRADVDDGVNVVGGSLRCRASLGAQEVDQLTADQRPAVVEVPVQVHQAVPRRCLR